MDITQLLVLNAGVSIALFIGLWLYSIRIQDPSFIDSWWPLGMVVMALTSYLITGGRGPHAALLTVLCAVWGLRLGIYLLWRWRKHGTDRRYATMMGKAKQLKRDGAFDGLSFTEIILDEETGQIKETFPCSGIELVWDNGKIIRFPQVEVLIEFLKKAA